MASLPSNVSLANIADGANIVASDHRNNYSSVQAYINALNAILAAGTTGQQFGSQGGTTVSWGYPPGYELAYVEFTSPVTVSSSVEASPTDVVSAGSVTFDGTAVWVEFFAPYTQPASAVNASISFDLYSDGTSLGHLGVVNNNAAAVLNEPILLKRRLTPAAGSHTLKIGAFTGGANGTVGAGAGSTTTTLPGYIRVTKA